MWNFEISVTIAIYCRRNETCNIAKIISFQVISELRFTTGVVFTLNGEDYLKNVP